MIKQRPMMDMQSFLLSVGEKFVPILKESKFKETGNLTPEEFIAAGDYLVFKCPTWSWSSGEESRLKSYLPNEKQFLITRHVPHIPLDSILALKEGDLPPEGSEDFQKIEYFSETVREIFEPDTNVQNVKQEDEDIPDMECFEGPNILLKADPALNEDSASQSTENFVMTQSFDLFITYDKYYQTPRMWLSGFDRNGSQLMPDDVLELVSQDHARKTVTIEAFPHLPINMASVHPCRHAAVMKKIIDQYNDGDKEIRVDQYLVIFLKFMSSIMPSVDYDHTMSME